MFGGRRVDFGARLPGQWERCRDEDNLLQKWLEPVRSVKGQMIVFIMPEPYWVFMKLSAEGKNDEVSGCESPVTSTLHTLGPPCP